MGQETMDKVNETFGRKDASLFITDTDKKVTDKVLGQVKEAATEAFTPHGYD